MADEHMNDTWDASVVQASGTNLKRIVDDYADLANTQARSAQKQTDALWTQFLDQNRQWQAIAQQAAANLTAHSQRTSANAGVWDNLVFASEIQDTAQTSMATTLAEKMRSAAFEAVQAALGQTAQTSAAAQGTTGVAQGAIQGGISVADAAILAQVAKLAEAVNVLYIKVLGEEVTAEKPAA